MFFLFRTVTATVNVCRLFVVEGTDETDAREHFAATVRYRNPRLDVSEHDGSGTGIQITPRIREV